MGGLIAPGKGGLVDRLNLLEKVCETPRNWSFRGVLRSEEAKIMLYAE
jgi:hypothetical protein